MPLELTEMTEEEMTLDGVFRDVINAEWDSFQNPPARFMNLYFPIKGEGPEAHAERIEDSLVRQIQEHKESSSLCQWLKVVDTETGEIAGAAHWHTFETNPYLDKSASMYKEVTWWTSGEDRDFATSLLEQCSYPRKAYMQKPHMHLEACYTRPKYRRRGVGKLLMDWGVQRADKLSLESYIDATELGELLYKNHGYLSPGWVHLEAPANPNPSARWKELENVLLPMKIKPHWRPIGGKQDGSTRKPWEIVE